MGTSLLEENYQEYVIDDAELERVKKEYARPRRTVIENAEEAVEGTKEVSKAKKIGYTLVALITSLIPAYYFPTFYNRKTINMEEVSGLGEALVGDTVSLATFTKLAETIIIMALVFAVGAWLVNLAVNAFKPENKENARRIAWNVTKGAIWVSVAAFAVRYLTVNGPDMFSNGKYYNASTASTIGYWALISAAISALVLTIVHHVSKKEDGATVRDYGFVVCVKEIAMALLLSVILFVGVNGVGKTTTIAKIAHRLKNEGKKVLLAAGDTFRAGAVDQLEEWAKRVGVDIVIKKGATDPSSVIFDAVKRAQDGKYDVLLCDTAGRLQNKAGLMAELSKMNKVIEREIPNAPHETLLVIDATTGQNGLSQAEAFNEVTNVTGVILTKLDGTSKGGIVLAIRDKYNLPIKFVGLGEKMDDLEYFDLEDYIYGLFGEEDE